MIPGSLWTNQLKKPQVFEIFLGPEMSSISWLYFSLESKKSSKPTIFLVSSTIVPSILSIQIFFNSQSFPTKRHPKSPIFPFCWYAFSQSFSQSLKMDEFSRSRWNCWELMLKVAWRSEWVRRRDKLCRMPCFVRRWWNATKRMCWF